MATMSKETWWWRRSAPSTTPWSCWRSWWRNWVSTSSSSWLRSPATSAGHAAVRKTMSPTPETRNFCKNSFRPHQTGSGWADPVHPKPNIYSKMALNLIEKLAAANNPASSQKRKRSESSEEATPSRSSGPASRGGQAASNRAPSNRGGFTAHSAPNPPGSNIANSTSHSYQSWTPPRGRGHNPGRGEARGRGYGIERGHGNNRGGQPRRDWGRPWSRW